MSGSKFSELGEKKKNFVKLGNSDIAKSIDEFN